MNLAIVKAVFNKEWVELIRDRRTIMATLIMPMVMYPILIIGIAQVTAEQKESIKSQVHKVAIWNPEQDPALVEKITSSVSYDVVDLPSDISQAIRNDDLAAVVSFDQAYSQALKDDQSSQIDLVISSADDNLELKIGHLEKLIDEHNQIVLEQRLDRHPELDEQYIQPLIRERQDVATEEEIGASLLGKVFPFLCIMMILSGIMAPSIELVAGEKESGTLETLLTTPAPRQDVVVGKFLTVLVMGLLIGLVNMFSFAFSIWIETLVVGGEKTLSLYITPKSIVLLLSLVLPIAVLFSAVMMAISSFARSFKEAQTQMGYFMTLAAVPTAVNFIPGFKLEGMLLYMPIANLSLLFEDILSGRIDITHCLIVIGSTALYAAASLMITMRLMGREEILFSDGGSLRLLSKNLLQGAKNFPAAGDALLLLAIAFPGFILASRLSFLVFQDFDFAFRFKGSLLLGQLMILLMPLLALWRSTVCKRDVLGLKAPTFWGSLWMPMLLATSLLLNISWESDLVFDEDTLKALEESLTMITGGSLWQGLFWIALLPAVCEEIMFRGFVLKGLRRSMGVWPAVLLSALLFAFVHLDVNRLLPTFVLGIGLGMLRLAGGSLWLCILWHFLNNGLGVYTLVEGDALEGSWLDHVSQFCQFNGAPWLFLALYLGIIVVMKRGGLDPGRDPSRGA